MRKSQICSRVSHARAHRRCICPSWWWCSIRSTPTPAGLRLISRASPCSTMRALLKDTKGLVAALKNSLILAGYSLRAFRWCWARWARWAWPSAHSAGMNAAQTLVTVAHHGAGNHFGHGVSGRVHVSRFAHAACSRWCSRTRPSARLTSSSSSRAGWRAWILPSWRPRAILGASAEARAFFDITLPLIAAGRGDAARCWRLP